MHLSFTIHSLKFSTGSGISADLNSMVRSKEDPMLLSRKLFLCVCIAVLLVPFLSCGSAHDTDEYYVFVAANLQVPYWQTAGAGFSKAAEASKIRVSFVGPQSYDPKAERDALDQAVLKKAPGILLPVTQAPLFQDSICKAVARAAPLTTAAPA